MSLVQNVYKQYKSKESDFTLDIPKLELLDEGVTAIQGASGSGKTTLFRILLGLEPCENMQWIHKGEDLAQLPVEKRNLGVVFQSLELFPHMTARENVMFAGKARGLDKVTCANNIKELQQSLELERHWDKSVQSLSGGQRQRVALARALIAPVRYLFLDEPFSALDIQLREKSRKIVMSVIEKYKVPTLLISHDPADIKAMANRVVHLVDGQVTYVKD